MTKGRIKACQNCSTLGVKALNGNLGQLAAVSSFKLAQYNINSIYSLDLFPLTLVF